MTDTELSLEELQLKAVEVLFRELGPKNAIRYLGLNPHGSGNYTEERRQLFDHWTTEMILDDIKTRKAAKEAKQ